MIFLNTIVRISFGNNLFYFKTNTKLYISYIIYALVYFKSYPYDRNKKFKYTRTYFLIILRTYSYQIYSTNAHPSCCNATCTL